MTATEIDVDQLAALLGPETVLVDVRQPDEYAEAHVEGARLIPLVDLPGRVDEIPVGGPVYFICAVGGRSRKAAELLVSRGVDAVNVAGGTKAWIASGRSYQTGS